MSNEEDSIKKHLESLGKSHVFASVFTGNVDWKIAMEIGAAVLHDKPIIALVYSGVKVPEKLSRVIDKFVEVNKFNMDSLSERIQEAITELEKEGKLNRG